MICPKCGARLIEDSLFCDQCGQRVVAAATEASEPAAEPARPTVWPPPPPPPSGETVSLPRNTQPPAIQTPRRSGRLRGVGAGLMILLAVVAWATGGKLPGGAQPTATGNVAASQVASSQPTAAKPTSGPSTPAIVAQASLTPTLLAVALLPTNTSAVASTPTRTALPASASRTATASPKPGGNVPAPTATPDRISPDIPGLARVLAGTGISVAGPIGWTYVEDRSSSTEGSFLFYAQKSETTKRFFTSGGVFAISTWLAQEATEVAPEDILLGFLDAQVTEYASKYGGDPTVSKYTIQSIKNSNVTGWSTTFSISGKGGTFRYGWADLRATGRFVDVICQSAPDNWDAVSAKCDDAANTIDIGG